LGSTRRQDIELEIASKFREALWNGSRACHGKPQPFITNEAQCENEANSSRFDFGLACDVLHLETNQIVRKQNAPKLLAYTIGSLAPNRLLALEEFRFELVVAQLQFPAFMVQRDNLIA